jgi:hypothetical protein
MSRITVHFPDASCILGWHEFTIGKIHVKGWWGDIVHTTNPEGLPTAEFPGHYPHRLYPDLETLVDYFRDAGYDIPINAINAVADATDRSTEKEFFA